MNPPLRQPQRNLVLYGSTSTVVSTVMGEIVPDGDYGLFAGDTRLLCRYRIKIDGQPWQLLARERIGHAVALWQFESPSLHDSQGRIPGSLLFSLRREMDRGVMRDELTIQTFMPRAVAAHLSVDFDADFADIFEVKANTIRPRHRSRSREASAVRFDYEDRGFHRSLRVDIRQSSSAPQFTKDGVRFVLALGPKGEWRCVIEAQPQIPPSSLDPGIDPLQAESAGPEGRLHVAAPTLLTGPLQRSRSDLRALAMAQAGSRAPLVAAGAPWFLTLFGRDTLVTSLMATIDGSWIAEGALAALAVWQGNKRDDFRDEEPGKIPHELRRDERTLDGELPFSPYYGTHDASSLYCLALWNAWRWTGRRELLDEYFDIAQRALCWCETYGDRDGDGLQEYCTRSPKGYRHLGWKDAHDAVVYGDGRAADPPLATVELQGYWYAARLALADMLDARGDADQARHERAAAMALRARVEARYWMKDENFYAFALDRDKRHVDAIASNSGQLLWCGLPSAERAMQVARRLLADDMFSGWGLRTLSSRNPAYDPMSYQLGSVWPHDTVLAAAGLWRYGLRAEAAKLLHGILRAAVAFEDDRLPELFGGIDDGWHFPVPYPKANAPQAWAAAAPLLAVQLFLGLVPHAPQGRCYLSPWLPEWLPALTVDHIGIGTGELSLRVVRDDGQTAIETLRARDVDIEIRTVSAPLWGAPINEMSC